MDNLNTHTVGSLYQAFAPSKAFALAQRLEIHHTPRHGSWLNIAEIELSALSRQCLEGSPRISAARTPAGGVAARAEYARYEARAAPCQRTFGSTDTRTNLP